MWKWLAQNKEWVFSGAGVAVIGAVYWLVRKILTRTAAAPAASITQAPVINVAPIINLSQTTSEKPKNESSPIATVRPAVESPQDGRPVLRSLTPRICFITEGENDDYGFAEGGDLLRAVLASFRMYKPSADRRGTQITARLSYRTKSDFGIRETLEEVHRVNQGMWLDEGFNSIEFTLTDTKELILAVEGEGKWAVFQDNRHSVSKFKGPSVYELAADEFFVDVTLVDEFYGAIITYTYKIEINPLKVSEIIRVPR
jgi:hypothetical protein